MIKIIDSIMGSGKTSWAIQKMNDNPYLRYIYITPFLEEVERIKQSCPGLHFYEPQNMGGGKRGNLLKLLKDGKNIVSTHALFQMSTAETIQLLNKWDYSLILDEVFNVLEEVKLKKGELKNVILKHFADIDENNQLIWRDIDCDSRYNDIKQMALDGNLIACGDYALVWTFPHAVFECFKEVYILTYMFKYQEQRYYFDQFKIKYKYFKLWRAEDKDNKYHLIEHDGQQYDTSQVKPLINIYQGHLNSMGDKSNFVLSKSWYRKNKKTNVIVIKNNTRNYFGNIVKGKSDQNLWTVFNEFSTLVKGEGYSKGFLACNARSTNKYSHKTNIAYLINLFINPVIAKYFQQFNIKINDRGIALSYLLQFLFRSAIREGKPINLYIPSRRMRLMLMRWLGYKNKEIF
ncbi:MAG: DEAD/DEAH box helicase family protein [Sporomusaceae bacterium]|nr:DEAD/DEAH box helicase family protein [Sporomusaceae bacterium]